MDRRVLLCLGLLLAATDALSVRPPVGGRGRANGRGSGEARAAARGRGGGRGRGARGGGGRGRAQAAPVSNKERESRAFWEEEDSLLLENDRKRRRRVMGLEAPEPMTEPEPGGPRSRKTEKPLPALKVWQSEVGGRGGRGTNKGEPFFSPRTFAEVGASDELQAALAACGAVRPSHVQAAGYDVIAAGKDVILADQTGSGKTLGYLGPVVQRLRELEVREGMTPPGQVRAIVLAPTAELAQQVLRVAKSLSAGGAPFRSTIVTGEHKWGTQRKALAAGVELVVATPGRLRSHLNAEQASLQLGGLAHLVRDHLAAPVRSRGCHRE